MNYSKTDFRVFDSETEKQRLALKFKYSRIRKIKIAFLLLYTYVLDYLLAIYDNCKIISYI